jgi:hypothetical protein
LCYNLLAEEDFAKEPKNSHKEFLKFIKGDVFP